MVSLLFFRVDHKPVDDYSTAWPRLANRIMGNVKPMATRSIPRFWPFLPGNEKTEHRRKR
jgi:hypothetical protein